ncbi:MAG: hypothetical protein LKF42_00380 [Streptococcaceae bacterium]|jgi:hypothetical protein|nr:hypothetical protein [Streptococcaceae bacterium]MCH4176188.1 hypothetical protein [Streptococcaceae bacterium]
MEFKVIYPFIEEGKKYWSGDTYISEDKDRIKKLTTKNNKLEHVLIKPKTVMSDDSKASTDVKDTKTAKKVDGAPVSADETEENSK